MSSLPNFRLATRITLYIARNVLVRSVQTLSLLIIIYAAIDFVEASSAASTDFTRALVLYPFRLPMIVAQVSPLALSFGMLLALAASRTNGEWDALRAAGISPLRTVGAFLIVPLLAVFALSPLVAHVAPKSLSAWQAGLDPRSPRLTPTPGWCRQNERLIRNPGPSIPSVAIERDPDGLPISWAELRSTPRVWQRGRGWFVGQSSELEPAPCAAIGEKTTTVHGAPPGAALGLTELTSAIAEATRMGFDVSPLRAELALRVALAVSCVILPLLCLGIALLGEEHRATRLTARGVVVAAVFWFVLSAAWNGAVLDVWSPDWLSIGVPLGGLGVGAVLVLRAERR